jgi:hypothetical protein
VIGVLAAACGGAPPPVVEVPSAVVMAPPESAASESEPSAPVPSAERVKREHPLDYYVGTWDGVFTDERRPGSWETVLTVDGYGNFVVKLDPPPGTGGIACENAGRLRVEPDMVVLEIQKNSCRPDLVGAQKRPLVTKEADEFVLRTPEGAQTFVYTRRPEPTDDE